MNDSAANTPFMYIVPPVMGILIITLLIVRVLHQRQLRQNEQVVLPADVEQDLEQSLSTPQEHFVSIADPIYSQSAATPAWRDASNQFIFVGKSLSLFK